jgi:hypothetical protein
MGAAGSICAVVMRVAASDWWPSRRTVLLKVTGFMVLAVVCAGGLTVDDADGEQPNVIA